MTTETRTAALEVRVTPEEKEVLRKAAESYRQTMSSFIRERVLPDARAIVEQEREIELSERAWQDFWRMMESNEPVSELAREEAFTFLREMAGKPLL